MKEQEKFEYETPVLDVFQYHGLTIVHAEDQSRMAENIDIGDDNEF